MGTNTKENILIVALRLFAKDGYEAVSVSQIAGELGMTKGALYKHYKNKRDIFDSIFEHVCQLDVERYKRAGFLETEISKMPRSFNNISVESMKRYMEAQFYYWTEDEIACNFRRMLTLEQYRDSEMMALYQKVLARGPLNFIEDLLNEMMKQGIWLKGDAKQMALEFYAPFYLLLNISDAVNNKKNKIAPLFMKHMDNFIEKYAVKNID
ncbi:TetR/AcrR family transcriptional regulator [Thomasclavelia sp.]